MISSTPDVFGVAGSTFDMTRRDIAPVQVAAYGTGVSEAGHVLVTSLAASAYGAITHGPVVSDRRSLSHNSRTSKVEGKLARSINQNRPFDTDVPAITQGALSGVRAWRPPV